VIERATFLTIWGKKRQVSLPKAATFSFYLHIRIGTGAIPADHVNFLVTLQPRQDGFSRAIWQEIKRPARLKID